MSWAAHNPEAYEELERNAAAEWLGRFIHADDHKNTLEILVEELQEAEPALFRHIMEAGAERLVDVGDYFGGLVDAAMNSQETNLESTEGMRRRNL